ncbi:Crp/Fnr family transcriptional regulator [Desulfobulbus sp.]|uniref:Crp/Fnr family transcriptional regulator n=1 Tax=Desulfobulbus sp. TaxID=895 RepID=UPI0027B8AAC8|nr:Crp/Fnr family transcriptional regulator [Desulfobulbus sp.]
MQNKQDDRGRIFRHFAPDDENFEELMKAISYRDIAPGTILLSEGEVASKLFFVVRGCLRTYFIKEDGKDITAQFFVEDQIVASFESATTGTPSRAYIEAIENSVVGSIPLQALEGILNKSSAMREGFRRFLMERLAYYMERCSSYILDNPEKRYLHLLEDSPKLVDRLPKQYIASYLGITPVSLSRIRNRLKEKTGRN